MHLLFLPGFTVELGCFRDMSGEDKYASELTHENKEGDDEVYYASNTYFTDRGCWEEILPLMSV